MQLSPIILTHSSVATNRFDAPVTPSRPGGPAATAKDSVSFGSMDDLYRLRLAKYEDQLQEPAIQNVSGSVSLLQVLEALVETANAHNYITIPDFMKNAIEQSERGQMEQALARLKEFRMLEPYYDTTDRLSPTGLGKAATRLLNSQPASQKTDGRTVL